MVSEAQILHGFESPVAMNSPSQRRCNGHANSWTEVYRYDTRTGRITETGVSAVVNPATQLITLPDPATGSRLFWRLVIEQVP